MKNSDFIDLRSDTVTLPSAEMREAIYKANVGDHGYGEDETTLELERYCAKYFGKDAALFMPSGTMSDQVAIRCYTQPGDEIILDASYHINYFQAGSAIDLGKISLNTCNTKDGVLTPADIEMAIYNKHRGDLFNAPKLLCLENTINGRGGKIFPIEKLQEVCKFAKSCGLSVHMDGERFLNACVATKISPSKYAECVDSISTSFSKGLGGPFGSILMGSKEVIKKAEKYRRWYGGSLHQCGFMAAAALYAITYNVQRLEDDHKNAKLLGALLSNSGYFKLEPTDIETNIIMLNTKSLNIEAPNFVDLCKKEKVLLYPWDKYVVRAITHLNISEQKVYDAANKIVGVCRCIMGVK
jgi:threonine aldolase